MPKHKKWNKESCIIKLKPNWKQEMVEAHTKYKLPYKKVVRDLEKALEKGVAVICSSIR